MIDFLQLFEASETYIGTHCRTREWVPSRGGIILTREGGTSYGTGYTDNHFRDLIDAMDFEDQNKLESILEEYNFDRELPEDEDARESWGDIVTDFFYENGYRWLFVVEGEEDDLKTTSDFGVDYGDWRYKVYVDLNKVNDFAPDVWGPGRASYIFYNVNRVSPNLILIDD